jgi:hypothetical protein
VTAPTDPIVRGTLSHRPISECGVCGAMVWKRTSLVAGSDGGLAISAVTYRECDCGRREWTPEDDATE